MVDAISCAEQKRIVGQAILDMGYLYEARRLQKEKLGNMASECKRVLDFGKSSREFYTLFAAEQIQTVDINQYEGYPDLLDNLCSIQVLEPGCADGIICFSILEHVYDPTTSCHNLHVLLQEGGYLFGYAPFLYRYHAPANRDFMDFFRYTSDGLSWLLKDFSSLTLYPIRGPFSTMFNLRRGWKRRIEKNCGQVANRWIDWLLGKLLSGPDDCRQVSGHYFWAVK